MLTYQPNLLHLPNELVAIVVSHFSAHDLTQLSRTCKSLNKFAESRLWTALEFHHPSYHQLGDKKQPLPLTTSSDRFSHWGSQGPWRVGTLLQILRNLDTDRLKTVCARVKSICTVLQGSLGFWELLPYFVNLESLELHVDHRETFEDRSFDTSAPVLSKLRFARLVGYVPVPVVEWLLASGKSVERLELDLLMEAIPVASCIEDILEDHPEDTDSPLRDDRQGDRDGWSCIPRPLSGFLPDKHELALPNLRYLYLCQPSDNDLDNEMEANYFWSTHAEVAAHKDWEQILKSCSATLETLVVEQRIGMEDCDPEGDRQHEFIKSDHQGLRSKRLMDLLGEVLAQQEFPVLRHVLLKGIAVKAGTPGGDFMELLRGLNVRCEARLGDCYMFDMGIGIACICEWDVYDENYDHLAGEEILATV
ncbi:hypothetical protein FIE12Z_12873 [Fusarium flagelliforme]|uniref:F-box domain-containing protein n=1 Tax=Fusarium flagelliforme TaxID=2675880 RepID=A0A395M4T5_9HYPO|nr:hypothetical protein FIE12Z_12873 [Fusarium flagelliforme]